MPIPHTVRTTNALKSMDSSKAMDEVEEYYKKTIKQINEAQEDVISDFLDKIGIVDRRCADLELEIKILEGKLDTTAQKGHNFKSDS